MTSKPKSSSQTSSPNGGTTHFGFETVDIQQKQQRINEVFRSVADNYDLMNHIMSSGMHKYWKKEAVKTLNVAQNHRVLDLAGGTGDLTSLIQKQLIEGFVVLADINESMLRVGRDKLIDQEHINCLNICLCNGERLPFASESFERCIIGFGLRNVTDKQRVLSELYSVLSPGGNLVILEFSHVREGLLKLAYDWYSFSVLPNLGKIFANDSDSYRYLAESIRKHPSQEELNKLLLKVGFKRVSYKNYLQGIVCVHQASKVA